jgi:hypothetical protein
MRSNTTITTKNQPAPADAKSRGDSVNQVTLIGRLVAAPEQRETASGKHVTTVRIATNGKSHAEFHDVVLWGQLADSPRRTSARAAPSASRVGYRAASGRPPTEALDGPSRSSPIGSRRSPRRAPRRLRRRDRVPGWGSHPAPSGMATPVGSFRRPVRYNQGRCTAMELAETAFVADSSCLTAFVGENRSRT